MKTLKSPKQKNSLISALTNKDVVTGNNAVSHSTTGTALLDFFGKGGAMRNRPKEEIIALFAAAFDEDKTLALKALFNLADVRGGQGERNLFRVCFNWLANEHKNIAEKLLVEIPFFTRWDNVLESLENTPLEKEALAYMAATFKEQSKAKIKELTLFPKWCHSEQASSQTTKRLAYKLRKTLGLESKEYRKILSRMRAKLKIVERFMCANEWEEINYSAVPSRAATIYRNAFKKHDGTRYNKFLEDVKNGKKTINASVLYPYDIVRAAKNDIHNDTLDLQWKSLPDYLEENARNIICVLDVSGSMDSGSYYGGNNQNNVAPIDVALGLGIYTAERNRGDFKDYFITFSNRAKLIKIVGAKIGHKVQNILNNREVANTNLQSVFDLILNHAQDNKVAAKDMPSDIILISDMQFDEAVEGNDKTNFETFKEKYKKSGYKLPNIVFWNVNSYSDVPIKFDDKGVCLVSGCSPVTLKSILSGKIVSPWEVFINTVNVPRYKQIKA